MKMSKKIFVAFFGVILCVCMAVGLAACGGGKTQLESITLDKTTETIFVGETSKLKATPSRDLYEDEELKWKSDNEAIATVSGGVVTAKAEGTAKIVAYVGEVESEACTVTVKTRTITITAPEDLTLDLLDASKKTLQLSATSSEAGDVINWRSSNDSIATVDANGLVTAVGKGEADIIAKVGATEQSVTVTVTAPEDYYQLGRNNNATVYDNPDKWHWFSQGAAVYTLVSDPIHVNGAATLSFSKMVFTGDEEAGDTKMEYYFRYMPTLAEEETSFNFSCIMTTTISGKVVIGIDSEEDFEAVEFNLVAGENNNIKVNNLPKVSGHPLNIKILIAGATEANPLTISVKNYKFNDEEQSGVTANWLKENFFNLDNWNPESDGNNKFTTAKPVLQADGSLKFTEAGKMDYMGVNGVNPVHKDTPDALKEMYGTDIVYTMNIQATGDFTLFIFATNKADTATNLKQYRALRIEVKGGAISIGTSGDGNGEIQATSTKTDYSFATATRLDIVVNRIDATNVSITLYVNGAAVELTGTPALGTIEGNAYKFPVNGYGTRFVVNPAAEKEVVISVPASATNE